jgi:hypothetical protein
MKKLLELIGYSSSSELMGVLGKVKRNAIPKSLQTKLQRAFSLDISMCKDDPNFLFRGMVIDAGGETREVPYPLVPVAPLKAAVVIAGFGVEEGTRGKARVHARISVATNGFLSPRTSADAELISVFFLGSASLDGELEKKDKKTLNKWLKSSGFGPEAVSDFLQDDNCIAALRDQVLDRIEEMVGICGAEEITDNEGNAYVLEGEEEKGFASEKR